MLKQRTDHGADAADFVTNFKGSLRRVGTTLVFRGPDGTLLARLERKAALELHQEITNLTLAGRLDEYHRDKTGTRIMLADAPDGVQLYFAFFDKNPGRVIIFARDYLTLIRRLAGACGLKVEATNCRLFSAVASGGSLDALELTTETTITARQSMETYA